ncbi:hypothetical protein SAMN05660420_00474 [Desulfuromusa kysingii]|uniref:Uncharacterized protein n=1 Tax=Desulfuromusa kysingii TaxID=37625 RepID=A0A1H3W4P0_9BACT|nr:hypothetical protein [Desulfuromusa kysingii]SDZ82089.1 hypothetical protein SAMN05660420_00474 [Desulfuromusa kysingii]
MILHPGILSLLSGSLLTLLVMLIASGLGIRILLSWDASSSSEGQIILERKTWLVSTLVNYALGFQIFSAFLFIATAEDIHQLFVGAMCATGSLNANLVGWLVLLIKGILLFAAALWVILNRLDQRTEDCPLVRQKYFALLLLTPLVALDGYLQWRYFRGLQPEIITSCCGSLFSADGESVVSELAGMPARQAMLLFFSMTGTHLIVLSACLRFKATILRPLLFMTAVLMLFISLGAIISFISLYIYQMPSHHCPFDMLQSHYGYVGYPIYAALFIATLYGMLPGICQPLRQHESIEKEVDRIERNWLWFSLWATLIFLLISCWQMVFGSFTLLGY